MDTVNTVLALHHYQLLISFALKSCLLLHTFYQRVPHWLLSPMLPISAFLLLFPLVFAFGLAALPLLVLPVQHISPRQHSKPILCLCLGCNFQLEDLVTIRFIILIHSITAPQCSPQLNPNLPISLVMNSVALRNYLQVDHQGLFG
jgi:hypothetical protein